MNLKQKLMQKSADTRTKHKGQTETNINLLLTVGVIFVVVAVTFGIGGIVLGEVEDETREVTTVTNETLNTSTTTLPFVETTANPRVQSDSETIISYNVTSGTQLGTLTETTNYTVVSYTDGQFNITSLGTSGSDIGLNISYSFAADTNATTILGEGQTALVDLSGWLPIIGVVVAATIIIGLLLAGFGRFSGGI